MNIQPTVKNRIRVVLRVFDFNRNRFGRTAVNLGIASAETVRICLKEQTRLKIRGEWKRLGELMVDNNFITKDERDQVLKVQGNPTRGPNNQQHIKGLDRGFSPLQIGAVSLAAGAFLVAILRFDMRAGDAASIVSLCLYVSMFFLEFTQDRLIGASAYRAIKPVFALVSLVIAAYGAILLVRVQALLVQVPETSIRTELLSWVRRVQFVGYLMVGAITVLLIYSNWKSFSQRLAECRVGVFKDVMIRVEEVMKDRRHSNEDRQVVAINTVLSGLRKIIELSPWDRILKSFTPRARLTTVLYFVTEQEKQRFRIDAAAYPERLTQRVENALLWIRKNHFPSFFREVDFNRLVDQAKGRNPNHWQDRFLNFVDRFECVSVCGWIFAKQCPLISLDAGSSLALDHRFLDTLADQGYTEDELRAVQVGSFVGCPVNGSNQQPHAVLLVVKNLRNGVNPEDLEAVVVASQIIESILRGTDE